MEEWGPVSSKFRSPEYLMLYEVGKHGMTDGGGGLPLVGKYSRRL